VIPFYLSMLIEYIDQFKTAELVAISIICKTLKFSDRYSHAFCVRKYKTDVFVLENANYFVTVLILSHYCNQKEMYTGNIQIFSRAVL
jgi:hypothetical protein